MERIALSWSGGKDSCMALHEIKGSSDYAVGALLTTITQEHDRVSMHGVRRQLLHEQAAALGLPLREVFIPTTCSNADYERLWGEALTALRAEGFATVAYGDLYLADIRAYRDRLMAAHGMRAIYPVWARDTGAFVRGFIDRGFRAVATCVDLKVLDESFAGRPIDDSFLADLPAGVDPCGENGEFHTFVFDGPAFARPVRLRPGERVTRGDFCFCDLEPVPLWTADHPEEGRSCRPC